MSDLTLIDISNARYDKDVRHSLFTIHYSPLTFPLQSRQKTLPLSTPSLPYSFTRSSKIYEKRQYCSVRLFRH